MNTSIPKILLLAILLYVTLFMSCEDFQEEEYSVSALDLKAQKILLDSTYIGFTVLDISNINTTWKGQTIFSDASVIYENLISRNIKVAFTDSCYIIRQSTEVDTIYIALKNNVSRDIVFFYDAVYDLQLISSDGVLLNVEPDTRTLDEIAASSLYTYDESYKRTFTKVLRERHEATITGQNYLIRLMRNDLSSEYGFSFRFCVLDKNNL